MSLGHKITRQPFKDFLKSYDESVAKAVAISENMKSELDSYGDIKQSLADAMNVKTGNVHFYGSRVIGTANADSDLDIYVDMGNRFNEGISHDMQKMYLAEFKQKLSLNTKWKIEQAILDASVPVLHLIYVPKNIKCEWVISVDHILS